MTDMIVSLLAEAYNLPEDKISSEMRRRGKVVLFPVFYASTPTPKEVQIWLLQMSSAFVFGGERDIKAQ